jgi:arylsulfatase
MNRIQPLLFLGLAISAPTGNAFAGDRPPNVVIIYCDDLGYADLSCTGAVGYETPNLDRMADGGMRFTSFYVAQAVCGASRAALLTGCYPNRIGMFGAPNHTATHGIHERETLIPELCRAQGYATGMVGKWHLGHHQPSLPIHHGFDEYLGLPYSNDMWPFHPDRANTFPDLPMIEGDGVLDPQITPEEQCLLTTQYTERAVDFIARNHDRPFFLYVAHSMPHVPLFVSKKYAGASEQGLFGDVIMEIDWSVGEILAALDQHGLTGDTLVIFSSDNGPWINYGNHAGSAGPLREGKGTTWEGGVRVPCLMRWPGHIPAGCECHELCATIDLLPTIAGLIGSPLPELPIDGLDIWPLMSGHPAARTPHDVYYFYWARQLQAIRAGDWKLHFPHDYRSLTGEPGMDGQPAGYSTAHTELALYNLRLDIGEQHDLSADHPDIVARLEALAETARVELGDSLRETTGSAFREPASFEPPAPAAP